VGKRSERRGRGVAGRRETKGVGGRGGKGKEARCGREGRRGNKIIRGEGRKEVGG